MNARDIGAHVTTRVCAIPDEITAGGAGDATEVDGVWIDRQGFLSAKATIAFDATLGDGDDLSIAANIQHADDDQGTGVEDFGDALANAVVATGGAGGSNEVDEVELDVNLSGAKQFVRVQFTPNLSAATTDTAKLAATLVLGGADVIPAS